MTRKALNHKIDDVLIKIADANGLNLSHKDTIPACQALFALGLERLSTQLVQAVTGANRVTQTTPTVTQSTAVLPTVLRAAAMEAA